MNDVTSARYSRDLNKKLVENERNPSQNFNEIK